MKPTASLHAHTEQASGRYLLRLYVAGTGHRSTQAIANIKNICEQYLSGRYQLEVIDLYQQPEYAKDAQIIAIPTLIKVQPLPLQRIIGDLANTAQVCASLDIPYSPANAPPASPPNGSA
jgi:circadian clock protein KaiB